MLIRNCNVGDLESIKKLVEQSKPLILHTTYTYWVLFYFFNDSCFVMEDKSKFVGFVSGMKSTALKDTFFVWQIGIILEYRGKGRASELLEKIVSRAKEMNCKKIQFSIEPDNELSYNLFSSFAKAKGLTVERVDEVKYLDFVSKEKVFENHYEIKL